ncbi:MAG TPA: lamin tail domain-containing protein [Bacteroidia bacterium]|jgi:hypothetical protein
MFRNSALLFLLFIFSALPASAQVNDNFSDGDFTVGQVWTGNDTDFTVNASKQLQLNSSGQDTSYLITPNTSSMNNCEWKFWIRLNFSPSASNNAKVYLVSNVPDLNQALNGYYLQFGEALANDQVELFRQTGTASTSVCRGTTLIASAFTIGVRVTRDNAGLWKLFIDPNGGSNYALEASGTDNTYTSTNYFGVKCYYTTINSTKFYFDDFYVNVDNTPPAIDSINVIDQNRIAVFFNEPVDTTTAQVLANYSANNGLGTPDSAKHSSSNSTQVNLHFANVLQDGIINTLTVTNVQDLSGNAIVSAQGTFFYYIIKNYDVLINEMMVDESPAVSLPSYEYVELYNTTNLPLKLGGWKIQVGSNTKVIPSVTIQPDSFVVLTSTTGAPNFTGIPVVGVTSFPALTNTGNTVTLKTPQDQVISSVSYTDQWYQDPLKMDGGWSLEQVDPSNPCAGMDNWRASVNPLGGTPGRRNSVLASNADNSGPGVLRVSVIAPYDTVQVFFTEPIDSTTMMNPATYTIDNSVGNPIAVDPVGNDFMSVKLTLAAPLSTGIIYTINVANQIKDCAGNIIGTNNTAKFAIPQPCLPNDIVINEILTDPNAGGVDFVEVYNRSSKVIDLKTLNLCTQDTVTGILSSVDNISTDGYLIFPGDYLVLTANSTTVKSQYYTSNPNGFIDMPSIPSMNISDGVVVIADMGNTIIDKLIYNVSWQFPLLNSSKGVSLERIDYDRPTQDASNWHSAAQNVNATPGYKNSQYSTGDNGTDVIVTPEVFSPDNDGYNDVVNVSYGFDTPGFVANCTIFDSKGRLTRTLVRNELLGTSGAFSWDGITDTREKAAIGIYVIYFEVFDTKGTVKKYKRTCVLAGKL